MLNVIPKLDYYDVASTNLVESFVRFLPFKNSGAEHVCQVGVVLGVVDDEVVECLGGVDAQTLPHFVAKVAPKLFKEHSIFERGSLISLVDSNDVFDPYLFSFVK